MSGLGFKPECSDSRVFRFYQLPCHDLGANQIHSATLKYSPKALLRENDVTTDIRI